MRFWDSGPHHRSKLVRAFLGQQRRREVHRLPRYGREPNPEEWVWGYLKKHELASYDPHALTELKRGARLAVMRMRDRLRLLRQLAHARVRDP